MALNIATTGETITLDETTGLQNSTATPAPAPAGDANDNDIANTALPTAFSARLTALGLGAPAIGAALSGYTGAAGNTGSNIISVTPAPGGDITDLSLVGPGGAPLNGLDSGLDTLSGANILLYTDTNNNIVLGREEGTNTIVFALYLEETGTPVTGAKMWTVQYAPLSNTDPANHDDSLNLLDKVFVAASQNLEFSLAGAPSGQNLFLMFTTANPTTQVDINGVTRITDPTIIATGKDPLNQSQGGNITSGDTINSSQAAGSTTFGTNSQMITEQEGIRYTFVTGARQDVTIPNLDQNEADVEANIDFTSMFNARAATFDVVQLQSGKSAVVKVTALSTAAEPGVNFIDGYGNDATVAITHVTVKQGTNVLIDTSTGGTANGVTVAFNAGVATISGVQAGYTIEYTTTADHNRVLIENGAELDARGNTHADFDIGGFQLLQVSTATVEVGSKVSFEDDGPTVTANSLVKLDDDALEGGNPGGTGDDIDAENVSGTLAHSFGADGAGSIAYLTTGAPAGFSYVADGDNLLVQQGATTVLTLTLNTATGAYLVTQNAPIMHAAGLDENNQGFTINYRVTDGDGDTVDGTLALDVDDDTPTLDFGNLVGTGTITPQYGEWNRSVGADQPGSLDISLNQFQLVRPNGTVVNGSSFTFNELTGSPDASGNFLFAGSLTADFDNIVSTPDTTVDFTLTALNDGRYVFDLVQGFGSTVTFSSADGSLDAGGPDPVRTLTIPPDEQVVFFGVQATTSDSDIVSAIGLGEPDLTEAQVEAGGFAFLGSANMNVSTAGIGIGNNNLDGNTTAGINAGDESFIINPETLLTGMKVFIDNSVGGYDPATEELYYKIFFDDGTNSGNIKVLSGDLTPETGGQVSFGIETQGSKLIDSVQLTMGTGTIKIPVIEFIQATENLASDVLLDFTASLTDADGDSATSDFSVDLFANDLEGTFDFTLAGASSDLDSFNVDLSALQDSYKIEGFDTSIDQLALLGDLGANVSINNSGTDSIVSVTETGGQMTVITVVGVDLAPADVVVV